MSRSEYYPDWLYRKLFDDQLPWDKKSDINIDTFLTKYTLHDSVWIGIFHPVDGAFGESVTLAFKWDEIWIPEKLLKKTTLPEFWFVFIKIDKVDQISFANFERLPGRTFEISKMEFQIVENKKYLAIDDIFSGQVNIIFSGDASFLVLMSDERILNI